MKRFSIRILVAFVAGIAVVASASAPTPVDTSNHPALPAVALEQVALYRLEVALMVFYGGLLLITPAFSGLVEGRLPIEISARGAKFAGEAEESGEAARAAIAALERKTMSVSDGLIAANLEIKRLDELRQRDNTQPKVTSEL